MYHVHVVAIAAQLLPILASNGPTVTWPPADHQNCAPHTAVLSKHGDLAVIVGKNVGRPRLIYVRLRGRRPEVLEVPGAGAATVDDQLFQQYFADVAVSTDGVVFATATTFFSGAYSGNTEVPMVHGRGRSWATLHVKNVLDTTNLTIGGVDSSARVAVNGDFTNVTKNLDRAYSDLNYERPQAELVVGRAVTALGYGIITSVRAEYVSGYSSGNTFHAYPGRPFPTASALLWHDGKRIVLGSGVACDVNVHGVAAGSNERYLGRGGRPVVWRAGTSIPIGSGAGMAYAINDDGVAVGSIGQRAFIFRLQSRTRPTYLDDVIVDKTWHIDTAYGIANNGEILAIGHKRGEISRLLLLRPNGSYSATLATNPRRSGSSASRFRKRTRTSRTRLCKASDFFATLDE